MEHKLTFIDYEKASENNISRKTAYARLHYYGYDKETAITKPITDDEYTHWLNIAKENNISRSLFSQRIRKMTYEEAATKPVRKYKKRVSV